MASKGYIAQLLQGLPIEQRTLVQAAFFHVMDEWRIGTGPKATNASWFPFDVITPAVANTEFSIAHGLSTVPVNLFPGLRLDLVNAAMVPLTVSRVADLQRVYLMSPSTRATLRVWLET